MSQAMISLHAVLMADLVNSTGTTHRMGEEAAAKLWAAHDRVARDLLASWNGREIEKSDGFVLIFGDPADAANYALNYHRTLLLLPEPVQARVGLHLAKLDLQDTDPTHVALGARPVEITNWLAKATASRVMSLALGGQTLLTEPMARALSGSRVRVLRHGHWRLQGIDEPIEVFEAGDEQTAFVPPPDSAKAWRVAQRDGKWLPLRELPRALPAEPDRLIGRKLVLSELAEEFRRGAKLVSIHGIGGVGKTRTALHYAWTWLGEYPGGAWFCDLSATHSLDGLLYAVAQSLSLTLALQDPVAQIGQALAARGPALVVLDNFERLTSMADATVGSWMRVAPEARFLVTTRELLGIAGEHALTLSPLDMVEAASLFRVRAHAAARCQLEDVDDAAIIEKLVMMLDGLPLAIELAAARVRVMSVQTMLVRMRERFKLLAVPGRAPRRHATLRATLDWSWEQLSDSDRCALAQLAVFEGDFSLDDAEAVIELQGSGSAGWVLDAVQSLVEKSMVRSLPDGRFDLLGSVQDYAAGYLEEPGRFEGSGRDLRDAAYRRHWRHFGAFDARVPLSVSAASVGNLAAACRRAVVAGDAECAAGALAGMWAVLRRRGPFRAVFEFGLQVRELPKLSGVMRGTVERVLGSACESLGDFGMARAHFDDALRFARDTGDVCGEGWSLWALGEHLYKRGQADSSRASLRQALEIAQAHQLQALECAVLNAVGTLEMRVGNSAAAGRAYQGALALARVLNDAGRVGGLLGNLAILAYDSGAHEEAVDLYQQGLAAALRAQDRRWEGNTRCNLGLLLQGTGRLPEAEQEYVRALAIARETGHAMLEATVLCNLGILLDAQGKLAEACGNFEQAVAVALRAGDQRAEGQFRGYLGEALARVGQIEPAVRCLEAGEAALRAAGDEASLPLLLCQRAVVEHLYGRIEDAARTLSLAKPPPDSSPESEWKRAFDRAKSLIHQVVEDSKTRREKMDARARGLEDS